jgi:SAM-dependent methyltransferase
MKGLKLREAQFMRKCPVCGSESGLHGEDVNFQPFDNSMLSGEFKLAFCKNCGHIFYDADISLEQIVSIYVNRVYDESCITIGSGSSDTDDIAHQKLVRDKLRPWSKTTKDSLVLDVGAGRGGLTKLLTEDGYSNVIAIEPSEATVELLKKDGLKALQGSAEDLPTLPEAPKLMIYSNIMEHLLEHGPSFDEVKRVLSPDGVIYIEVPLATQYPKKGHPYHFLYMEHISHFTPSSLKNLLTLKGFEILETGDVGFCLTERDGITEPTCYAIAKPAPDKNSQALCRADIEREFAEFLSYLEWSENHPALQKLSHLAQSKRPIWLWGITYLTRFLLARKPLNECLIQEFIDKDTNKKRHTIQGKQINDPNVLKHFTADDAVVWMPFGLEKSMKACLADTGYKGEIINLRTDS